MSKAITKKCMALLKEASEMSSETGCVPGIDGEEVSAETIVPDAKEYISETIDDPEAIYDPEIWDRPGLRWSFPGWHKNGNEGVTSSRTSRQQEPCARSDQRTTKGMSRDGRG